MVRHVIRVVVGAALILGGVTVVMALIAMPALAWKILVSIPGFWLAGYSAEMFVDSVRAELKSRREHPEAWGTTKDERR